MPARRSALRLLTLSSVSVLTGCGTIIYPERVNQKKRGDVDVIVVGMDAVCLLFFLIPGIVAFAVDFSTGAIYFPEDHKKGKRETTIFDKIDQQVNVGEPLYLQDIEQMVTTRTGQPVNLKREDIRMMRIDSLDQFSIAESRLSRTVSVAAL